MKVVSKSNGGKKTSFRLLDGKIGGAAVHIMYILTVDCTLDCNGTVLPIFSISLRGAPDTYGLFMLLFSQRHKDVFFVGSIFARSCFCLSGGIDRVKGERGAVGHFGCIYLRFFYLSRRPFFSPFVSGTLGQTGRLKTERIYY